MRVLIAIPSFDERAVFNSAYRALWSLDAGENELLFECVSGYDCATARNKMAQKALDIGADYLLMVDSDTVLPEDALVNMLEEPVDVCLGYYAHRDADNVYRGRTNICKLYQPNGKKYFNYPLESVYTATEMHELRDSGQNRIQVHGGGMGCALIRTGVFNRIRYPWYDWVNYADDHRGVLSEDLYFCEGCRKHGIPIWMDTRVGCGHMFRYEQWPE